MYYNPNIPLETALQMFDDPHTRYEIIEDYHAALHLGEVAGTLGSLTAEVSIKITGVDNE